MELDEQIINKLNVKGIQSVRHYVYNDVPYCVFITKAFKEIGWMAEVRDQFYGMKAKLVLKEKDDIIDCFLTTDENAKATINELLHG